MRASFPRRRRRPGPVAGAVAAVALAALAVATPARAAKNDLNLLNLCPHAPSPMLAGAVPECSWVRRQSGGVISGLTLDPDAESKFRSLMSELGVVMAPRLANTANTLGLAGFQISGEIGSTSINSDKSYWDGVDGVSPLNTKGTRPAGSLTTVGVFVRKGLWIPLPAFEAGAGFVHLLDSQMLAWQGYAKLALHEGFHDWPLPSLAVRGSASLLTGTEQARMTVAGIDVILSKGFGLLKTARLEPFGGWSFLFIRARSGRIDATPSCDAYAVSTGVGAPGNYCGSGQGGTGNDFGAYFTFPDQDVINRHRFFGGAKLKFATVFLLAEYQIVPEGHTRDERKPNGARDDSGRQDTLSLSAGFDF